MYAKPIRPNELYHFGILGMRWGVRRYQNEDGSLTNAGRRHYQRQAKKDANEYARAKMYYGEGAGNRRKLINATVNERSKNKVYKQAFDENLAKQDMARHASKAKGERRRKDIKNSAGKTARGIYHLTMQDGAKVAAGVAGAYTLAKATGLDKKLGSWGNTAVKTVKNSAKTAYGRARLRALLRRSAKHW